MATHSTILAWSILWTEEPRGLQFESVVGCLCPTSTTSACPVLTAS